MFSRGLLLRAALCGALIGAASPALSLTLRRAVEPPPELYASGPTRTGRTWEMILPDVPAVDYICRLSVGGPPKGAGPGFYYWGCYDEKLDAVVLPDPKTWPSRREWAAIRDHEWAHARGWRHNADGHGTDWARSLAPLGTAPVRVAAGVPAS